MPHGYEVMRDQFARKMGLKAAKKKAAMIWNSKHKGAEAVGRYTEALCHFMEARWEKPTEKEKQLAYARYGKTRTSTSLKNTKTASHKSNAMWKAKRSEPKSISFDTRELSDFIEDYPGQATGSSSEGNEQGIGPASPTTSKSSNGIKLKKPLPSEKIVKPLANEDIEPMKTLDEFTTFMDKYLTEVKHIGFKAAAAKAANSAGVSKERGAAIIAASARKASAKAKAKNPRLKKVHGA